MKTESVRMSDERRTALEVVAAECGVVNQRGIEAGKPSWRALLYAIADGSVVCRPANKKRHLRIVRLAAVAACCRDEKRMTM